MLDDYLFYVAVDDSEQLGIFEVVLTQDEKLLR